MVARKQNKELEHIHLYVANLMNDEQNAHAKLITTLRAVSGKTHEFDDMLKVLTQVYEAKIELLEKIYKEIQGV